MDALQIGAFSASPVGLDITGKPTFEECAAYGKVLARAETAVAVSKGDFILYVEDVFGEEASQIIDHEDGWAEASNKVYRWVAKQVPRALREEINDPRLTLKHLLAVAALPPAKQKHWLELAMREDWSAGRLHRELRDGADAPIVAVWLTVLCTDRKDLEQLQVELEAKGRTTKVVEQRGKPGKKAVTARAKNPNKKKGRSKG